jgi:anti-sigma-K factor RskA
MTTDKFTALAEAFVLGTLDHDEARQFAQHLATGCPECKQAVEESWLVVSLLPYTASQKEPPPDLKHRLRATIATEEKMTTLAPASIKDKRMAPGPASIRPILSRAFAQRIKGTLAWAAVFLLVAMTYGYFMQRRVILQLRQQVAALEQQVNESRASIRLLEGQLARQQAFINRIKSSRLLLVELQGLPIHPSGRAKIVLDRQTGRGSFVAYNLPPLTSEQDYQLWYIKGGKPFDAGVFHINEAGEYVGEVLHLPETLAGVTAFAVTKEPKGGRPQPTPEAMYLIGQMRGG